MTTNEKVCSECAETVKQAAKVCKHCGHQFPVEDAFLLSANRQLLTMQIAKRAEHLAAADRLAEPPVATHSSKLAFLKNWTTFWVVLVIVSIAWGHTEWILVALFFWLLWRWLKKVDARERRWKDIKTNYKFSGSDGLLVKLDLAGERLATRKGSRICIFEKSDILSVDVERNGTSVQTIKRDASLTGAIVGGLIGGGVGAMIGATGSGTSVATSQDFVTALALRVSVRNPASPLVYLRFFDSRTPVPAKRRDVQAALKNLEEWRARFMMLLK